MLNLQIDNVSKVYKDKLAVNNFTAEITEGVYGLLGPNGAGKSTLMRMIVGVLKPSRGRVLVDGEDILEMGERYRDLLGYLPQSVGYYKNFTAERLLMYMASLKGLEKQYAKKKVDETLELVNLLEDRKRKIGGFSGGMKQRLGIAQALLNDPKILVVDEPTAGLDPKERIRFRKLLSTISRDRIVILSTHIVSDIEYIGKEVMLMRRGELIRKDTIPEILESLRGKVWEAVIQDHELEPLEARYKVGNVAQEDGDVRVRIVSEQKPHPRASSVSPTFEDVYIHHFEEAGNLSVAAPI